MPGPPPPPSQKSEREKEIEICATIVPTPCRVDWPVATKQPLHQKRSLCPFCCFHASTAPPPLSYSSSLLGHERTTKRTYTAFLRVCAGSDLVRSVLPLMLFLKKTDMWIALSITEVLQPLLTFPPVPCCRRTKPALEPTFCAPPLHLPRRLESGQAASRTLKITRI